MSSVDRIRSTLRARPLAADAGCAAVAGLLALLFPLTLRIPGEKATPLPALVICALSCLPLIWRRRRPVLVFALTLAGTVVATVVAGGAPLVPFGLGVALYTVGVRTSRRTALVVLLTSLLTLALLITVGSGPDFQPDAIVGMFAQTVAFTAAGQAVRNRRAYVAAIEDRAVRAERTREEEAGRRVAEERLRIARELHDVVAHHVAVVSVQAGLAAHLVTTRPEAAREALGHVRRASAAILDELGGIVGVLRRPDDDGVGGLRDPAAPAAGLDRLDDLLASFATTGLRADCAIAGDRRELPGTVDLVAYRVLQEALTNAHKHGAGTATVEVAYASSAVLLTVSNPVGRGSGAAASGSGFGLIGMRERALAVGGTVRTGVEPDGQFRVRATLPVQAADPVGSSAKPD